MTIKNKIFPILLIVILSTVGLFGQIKNTTKYSFTGKLKTDSKTILQNSDYVKAPNLMVDNTNKKSPMLAGFLSLLIPGGGEFYTGNYLKAGIFAVLEAAVITTAVVYNNKGNDQTASFEAFANKNWDVKRYAQWTINNAKNINPSVDPNNYNVFKTNGNVDFGELNKLEAALGGLGGVGYTHRLPAFGEQQYYELIGKYPQYSHGWNDSNQSDTDFHILSPNFLFYSGERGKANDYYNISDRAIIGIYLNHFLSALDAVWSATKFNKNLSLKMRVINKQFAGKNELVPTLKLKFSF